ncbi:putative membrane protein DUF2207 [Breoghania corrubedonensis]|uniref:Putative membrane protein DUF2207 n=1 Tax=Breoghania corrubedonensis TaxID=665038 RepID=A0A2T5VEP1_9HYPH|nr:DUF2207 domain-containing protein [Breoghania corrubedonensis]PTW62213.1 putative membrane protein DUF2207 [Breoghania corrubedonensis]
MPFSQLRRPGRLRALGSLCATLLVLLGGTLAIAAGPARAEERITDYTSTIRVKPDGTLLVTETITANAEGDQIRRGIYRDFPLVFEDAAGARHKAGFHLVSIKRDGHDEEYKENRNGDGIRIYIGDPNATLANRAHTFEITYETTRQIRFFEDHDELYWNVTGQEWAFPIDQATARVMLPDGVAATKWTAFTGRYGEKGTDWTASPEDGGKTLVFSTTRRLAATEGFSVVVALPKGSIARPTASDRAGFFFLDHRDEILAIGGFTLVVIYFVWAWLRVGRDPRAGTIIPLFEAPEGVSPALADYIHNLGFSGAGWRALSAASISLAVKGYLELVAEGRLEQFGIGSRLTLRPTGKKDGIEHLPPGEAAIMKVLGNRPLTLSKKNGARVQTLGSRFRAAIAAENRNRFFKANVAHWLPGLGLSILAVLLIVVFGDLAEPDLVFLAIVTIVVTVLTITVVRIGIDVIRNRSVAGALQFILIGAMVVIFMSGVGAQIFSIAFTMGGTPLVIVAIVALLCVNVLFYYLMSAPTAHGRAMMDQLEGLKLYLSVAERERLNMNEVPEMSPTRFETLLPYAVALKVEKPWSEAFQNWLTSAAAATTASAAYSPLWYHGHSFAPETFGATMTNTVNAMSQSFTSSLPTPKSSSSGFSGGGGGGGGGGAGGGGGGGGGGGW